jgi:Methyltransferase domain
VDVRDSANPVLARARRWLARVNARHPWNHNEHFHGWILRNLPARRRAAVDVGCGTGVLTGKLAPHFARVTGIDADAGMAAAASARLAQDPRVTIRRCGFEEFAAAAGDGEADLITMVAVLHHLGLDDTLARIPGLLAPGGRLLVVGLARVNSLPDLAVDLISAAANPVMGLIRHPRPARPAEGPAAGQPVMPVRDPPHYPGGDHRSGQGPPAGRHRPAALVLPLLSALGQAADDRTTAGLWQPRSPVNHRTADRPAHRTRTPRRAQAGGGSPRRVQVADYRVCPLPVGARRASPPLGTPAPTTAPVR